jgi:hypothetical protein
MIKNLTVIRLYGLTLHIETPKGSLRYGHGWVTRAPEHYGFIGGYIGSDGDEMDCYIGAHIHSGRVFVIDQNAINSNEFDEHKCMIGFYSKQEALACYLAGHQLGRKIFRSITALSIAEFKSWLKYGNPYIPLGRV